MPDNTDTPIKLAIRNEQSILRTELQELKRCQLQYFLFSLAATGAVFGFNKELIGANNTNLLFLTPLIVILPCWWTFFDKATTITRLTGYIRVFIEDQLNSPNPKYIGYENALSKFRKQEELDKENQLVTKSKKLRTLKKKSPTPRHRYWMINWYTFLILSLICCFIPILKENNFNSFYDLYFLIPYSLFALGVLISSYYTFRIVRHLKVGKYSYEKVTEYWNLRVLPI